MQTEPSGFVAGTLVHTDSGLVPIQDIKVGDKVLSKPEDSPDAALCYQCVTATHRFADSTLHMIRFCEVFPDSYDKYTLIEVFATPNHLFWQKGVCRTRADQLRCGDEVLLESGNKAVVFEWAPVLRTKQKNIGWVAVGLEQLGEMNARNHSGHLIEFSNDKISTPFNHPDLAQNRKVLYWDYAADDLTGGYFCDWTVKHTVYNLSVENTQTYFVHTSGIWVSQMSHKRANNHRGIA